MKQAAIVLCAIVVLAGCSTAPAEQPPAPQTHLVCPPFRAWSDADLKALGQALEPIPEDSIILRMALDWRRYYGDAKSCAGAQKP